VNKTYRNNNGDGTIRIRVGVDHRVLSDIATAVRALELFER
jgi:hypothetical protein